MNKRNNMKGSVERVYGMFCLFTENRNNSINTISRRHEGAEAKAEAEAEAIDLDLFLTLNHRSCCFPVPFKVPGTSITGGPWAVNVVEVTLGAHRVHGSTQSYSTGTSSKGKSMSVTATRQHLRSRGSNQRRARLHRNLRLSDGASSIPYM